MSERDADMNRQLEQCFAALRTSEARFRNIMDRSADVVLILDNSGAILFANPAAEVLFGRRAEELIGEVFGFPCMAGETSELTVVSRKGQQAVIEMRVVQTYWEGEPALLANLRDVSERKRAEEEIKSLNAQLAARAEELEAANVELEAFNYTVAHDLRSPLNIISGYCQAMKMLCGENLDEKCTDYLEQTYQGTLRMNRLIDALLNFSHMARVELRWERVDLSALAEAAADELRRSETDRKVTFRIAEGITAHADANVLRVVMDNFLGNAWKYTAGVKEGVIEFGETEVNGDLAYFVRDNGAGFDMSEAGKLFRPFQRLAGAEGFRGFGIGLATVERIIRRHGGQVWAEGEPGKGATFYFTLPDSRDDIP